MEMTNAHLTAPATINSASISSQDFDEQFRSLLAAWNTHHTNRTSGASVSDLAASRSHLDANRLDTRISLAS